VWDAVGYDRQRDESLAEEFVAFMGVRFPAESSADDLAFHRDRASRGTAPVIDATATATATAAPMKAPQAPRPRAAANTSAQR
jgi:hypothetical protein